MDSHLEKINVGSIYLTLYPQYKFHLDQKFKLSIWSKSTTGFWNARELKTNFSDISSMLKPVWVNDH